MTTQQVTTQKPSHGSNVPPERGNLQKTSNTKIGIVNAVLFVIVFLLTIFKKGFPILVLPTWLTPLMEEPRAVSIASILRTALLLIIVFVDIVYLLNNNKHRN